MREMSMVIYTALETEMKDEYSMRRIVDIF